MIGNKGGMVKVIEQLMEKLVSEIAHGVEQQAYYARESHGCDAEDKALSGVATALRQVDVPWIIKSVLEVKDEDHPQPD